MPDDAILKLAGVVKRFGGLTVSENISFDVPRGAKMALIGPNGAGKTTLFNLISGVYQLDGGSITLDGQPIDTLPSRLRVRAGLARSFQNIRLMPHLSVVENVMRASMRRRPISVACSRPSPGSGAASGAAWQRSGCARPDWTSIRTRPCRGLPTASARRSRSCAR